MKHRLSAAIALILAACGALMAQNGTLTPYSAFGYGMLRDGATSTQRSMGGIGYAMNSGRQINTMNPASYAATDSLTFLFDLGIDVTMMWQKEVQTNSTTGATEPVSDKRFGGGLDYATMQFPLGKYMGGSVGLLPYSSVGYAFGNKIENGIDSRQGSGNLSEFYVGVAGRPFKGFTIGANISYLFGTILNETYATQSSSNYTVYQDQLEVRDFHLVFGAQYSLDLNKTDRLTLGLTYSPAKTLLGNARRVAFTPADQSDPVFSDEHSLKGNYSLPEKWGAGVNYSFNRKFMVEFDYTYQPWSKAKFRGFEEGANFEFADRTKYALGMQYVPDARGSYFKRINYRLGGFWTDDYMKVQGNQLHEYGVTLGFGFPVPSLKTTVNLGFEWLHRQAKPDPLIKENYLNITVGVNFNEMWFLPSKIY
ncbi:MAG: outer membrane protein transport protein [Muribaculaceae bacterium]|nr:outer membrane protein transport protein [Muribaculaceae bacterium]